MSSYESKKELLKKALLLGAGTGYLSGKLGQENARRFVAEKSLRGEISPTEEKKLLERIKERPEVPALLGSGYEAAGYLAGRAARLRGLGHLGGLMYGGYSQYQDPKEAVQAYLRENKPE